jgi:hypothetical protein
VEFVFLAMLVLSIPFQPLGVRANVVGLPQTVFQERKLRNDHKHKEVHLITANHNKATSNSQKTQKGGKGVRLTALHLVWSRISRDKEPF